MARLTFARCWTRFTAYLWMLTMACPAVPTLDAEAYLAARCKEYAVRVIRRSADLAHRVYAVEDRPFDDVEYTSLAECAVFVAFVELGGDVDHPWDFAWDALAGKLNSAATLHLRRDLRHRGSDYFEKRACRQRGLRRFVFDSLATMETTDVTMEHDHEAVKDALLGLWEAVRDLLNPTQQYYVTEHYFHDRPLMDLAAELVARDPEHYAHTKGGAQAARAKVSMHLMRARRAIAKKLDAAWERRLEMSVTM